MCCQTHSRPRNGLRMREGNPARRVESPRVETVRKPGVPVDRIRALLIVAESDRMYAYWRLLATLPLRPGEPLGARIADLHLDPDREHDDCLLVEPRLRRLTHYCMRTNLVSTRDAFEVRPGVLTHWRLNDLKRHRARAIWLPSVTVEALRRRLEVRDLERMAAGSEWIGSAMVDHRLRRINPELVFCSPLGEPLYIQLLRKELASMCESAQVPRLTPHELRHAATTLLEEAGVADSVVQQLGGWSDRRMTDYYTGTLDESCRRAVELLAKLLEG
jgi:integrase